MVQSFQVQANGVATLEFGSAGYDAISITGDFDSGDVSVEISTIGKDSPSSFVVNDDLQLITENSIIPLNVSIVAAKITAANIASSADIIVSFSKRTA